MLSIEICTLNTPEEVEPGVWNSPLPEDSSGLHIQGINLGHTSLPSTSNVLDTSRDVKASGASVIPAEAPVAPPDSQLQQLHASKPTHAYHQRSVSSSSNEEELAKASYNATGGDRVRGGSAAGARVNDMVAFNEADAALLISPIISRTQSTTFYDSRRNGNATGVQRPSMVDVEDIEDDTSDVQRYPPRMVVNHTSSMSSDSTRKEQKMSVLSSAAHRLSAVSGLYLTSKSGSGRHSPPEADSGTSTPKHTARKPSMFTFTLPSFHLPQMPSPPSFLSDITTRKRSKSNVFGNPFSKTASQSQKTCSFGRPTITDREISPPEHSLQRPSLTPLRRSSSQPSLLSYTSSLDEARFANVQSMTNARIKAIKDNFRGLSPGNTIANAANALSTYANSLNSVLSSAPPLPNSDSSTSMGAAPPPVKPHPLDTVEGDIIVMGGYRGSILRETSGQRRRVWIPLRVGLNLRKVNLEIGLNNEDEETMSQRIIPDGMLTNIGPVDIGRRLLRRLRSGEGAGGRKHPRSVWEYSYDWRLSPHILSRQLIEYLEKLPSNHSNSRRQPRQPGRGALVIAHSLGGLIVRHAINQRPELFSGVLFVGTPQHCVNILGPLRNGDTVLLSSRVLTAQVNFTLRSSYVLLPEDGHCFVNKKTGGKINMDFFDVNTWIKHALSPCVTTVKSAPAPSSLPSMNMGIGEAVRDAVREGASSATRDRTLAPQMDSTSSTLNPFSHLPSFLEETVCTLPTSETIPYLDRTLKAIKQFKEELRFKPEIGYPPEKEEQNEALEASPVPMMNSWNGDEITSLGSSATVTPMLPSATVPGVSREERKSVYYPPMAIIYANNTPTVKGARVDGIESIPLDNVYDDLIFGAGDGVCLAKAAQLPRGYKACAKVLSDRGHIGLLGDLDSVGKAIEGVVRERGW